MTEDWEILFLLIMKNVLEMYIKATVLSEEIGGNSKRSSCMLLQKSCHDMDILQWLIGKKCKKVQSFGALSYFKEENAPKDAPDYCIQGCPKADTCPYNAVRLYLDDKENDWFRTTLNQRSKSH